MDESYVPNMSLSMREQTLNIFRQRKQYTGIHFMMCCSHKLAKISNFRCPTANRNSNILPKRNTDPLLLIQLTRCGEVNTWINGAIISQYNNLVSYKTLLTHQFNRWSTFYLTCILISHIDQKVTFHHIKGMSNVSINYFSPYFSLISREKH